MKTRAVIAGLALVIPMELVSDTGQFEVIMMMPDRLVVQENRDLFLLYPGDRTPKGVQLISVRNHVAEFNFQGLYQQYADRAHWTPPKPKLKFSKKKSTSSEQASAKTDASVSKPAANGEESVAAGSCGAEFGTQINGCKPSRCDNGSGNEWEVKGSEGGQCMVAQTLDTGNNSKLRITCPYDAQGLTLLSDQIQGKPGAAKPSTTIPSSCKTESYIGGKWL